MLVVAGENIADILPGGRAVPGGAALNAARAAGRLGAKVAYLTPLSADPRGRMLRDALVADGVKILPEHPSPKPCSLAEVSVDENGKPAYAFSRDGAADADFAFADLPPLPETAAVLHLVGALALDSPAGPAFEKLARAAADRRVPICADPNIRPALVRDEPELRARLARIFARAAIVKLSDEDAEFLFPGDPESCFEKIQSAGAGTVIMTRGENGATARSGRTEVSVPAKRTDTTKGDTVGAGDCFAAAILFFLEKTNALQSAATGDIGEGVLGSALTFASAAAAVNCARPGCDPPTLAEVPGDWNF